MARYRLRRSIRRQKLLDADFTAYEAHELSRTTHRANYFRKMVRDKKRGQGIFADLGKLRREAEQQGWSKKRYRLERAQVLQFIYREQGWLDEKGRPDVWKLLRDYRDQAIASGDYKPPKKKRIKTYDEHGRRSDRGNIKLQKQRAKERAGRIA